MKEPRKKDINFVLPIDLTAAELALLEFTNGSATCGAVKQRLLVTSKEAYLWAAFIAKYVESRPRVTSETFERAIREVLDEFANLTRTDTSGFEASASEATYVLLISSFAQKLGLNVEFSDLQQSARGAYESLVKRGLIEDPFFLTPTLLQAVGSVPHLQSLGIAVLGLIPIEFGRVTEEGKLISLTIRSLYLDYERKVRGKTVSTEWNFRLLQLVKGFLDFTRTGLDHLDRKNASVLPSKTSKGRKSPRGKSTNRKQSATRRSG